MSKEYIGIDVSDNQGVIDWKKAKADGVQFAILRSVRRSGKTDYQFDANIKGCREENIPVAVYKYTYATDEALAEKEAVQVIDLLSKYKLKCKIFWDVEDRNVLQGLGKEKLTKCIKAAQSVIEKAGYEFCLYTGLYVYKENWFDFTQFSCPLWTARYPSTTEKTLESRPNDKYLPDVGRDIIGWQFSSNGRVDGISTPVDLDLLYIDPEELECRISEKQPENYVLVAKSTNLEKLKSIQIIMSADGIECMVCKAV